jgi:electron transfer flavoprotein beta subunit
VGNELGALLGAATLNGVDAVTPAGDHLVVERTLEDAVQVIEVALPAVLSLTSAINTPRIPGMRDVLAAGKRPTTELTGIAAPAPSAERASLLAVEQVDRAHRVVEGDTAEVVAELVDFLNSVGGAR